jgi:hypothetical protein
MNANIIPSFERFNYMLRTNKHIERKLVFDLLATAAQKLSFSNHWYLGFGSMWFGDFRLADRLLGIEKMISIERADYAERANFNRPLAGIVVSPGDSNAVLGSMGATEWENPVVAWLDYDGKLDEDVVKDIATLLQNAAINSVVVITVNAGFGSYKTKTEGAKRARAQTVAGLVESYLGSAAIASKYEPEEKSPGAFIDSVKEVDFPMFLSEAMLTYMEHNAISLAREHDGGRMKFVPLYRLHHKDGVDMITVGGVITTELDSAAWEKCLHENPILSEAGGKTTYQRLDLIPVTIKEKIALDSCLPEPSGEAAYIANAKVAGIKLSDDEMSKYRKFYRHFPVFVETPM